MMYQLAGAWKAVERVPIVGKLAREARAEVPSVSGGTGAPPPCATDARAQLFWINSLASAVVVSR
eukprot:scaffold106923_cov75-Phaeocystis_antarctica.AAC.1